MGPVDVISIGFPGNKFSGKIAPAIIELVDSGTIHILDLLFIMKDADGVITALEFHDFDEQLGAAVAGVAIASPGALGACSEVPTSIRGRALAWLYAHVKPPAAIRQVSTTKTLRESSSLCGHVREERGTKRTLPEASLKQASAPIAMHSPP